MTVESSSPSSGRHRAREAALQTLFAIDVQQRPQRAPAAVEIRPLNSRGGIAGTNARRGSETRHEHHPDAPAPPVPPPSVSDLLEIFDGVAENFEMPHAAQAFARDLVSQVIAHCESLDAIVSAHSRNWRVSRMAIVDRNILRLATFELAHTTTPAAVVLNEAVELARRFGSDESPPFVNGVLDAVAREVRGEESR